MINDQSSTCTWFEKRNFRPRVPAFRADTCVALFLWLSLLHSAMNDDACGSHIPALAAAGGGSRYSGERPTVMHFYSQSSPQDGWVSTDVEVRLLGMSVIPIE